MIDASTNKNSPSRSRHATGDGGSILAEILQGVGAALVVEVTCCCAGPRRVSFGGEGRTRSRRARRGSGPSFKRLVTLSLS